jgi:hypothetical protein
MHGQWGWKQVFKAFTHHNDQALSNEHVEFLFRLSQNYKTANIYAKN